MSYFQHDVLKKVARFLTTHQWARSDSALIRNETGLTFSAPDTHSPWRNYFRVFKLCLLASEKNGVAVPTPIAELLTQTGSVTCDEYLHFLVEATTDPSPALEGWKTIASDDQVIRYPLCFALKYILFKVFELNEPITPIYEVIGAYIDSGFSGSEGSPAFIKLMQKRNVYEQIGKAATPRQARESIKFISQISYLHSDRSNIIVSLSQGDATDIFHTIYPTGGPHNPNGDLEIQRLANFFKGDNEHDFFEYRTTIVPNELESGFIEGSKVKKAHIAIERNSKIRALFFEIKPTTICDACGMDTKKKYPWVKRILDLHHILPLSSGTRVDAQRGTVLDDLVPVCPTCHRAIHRFYDHHFNAVTRQDFLDEQEARDVYSKAKMEIVKGHYNA